MDMSADVCVGEGGVVIFDVEPWSETTLALFKSLADFEASSIFDLGVDLEGWTR